MHSNQIPLILKKIVDTKKAEINSIPQYKNLEKSKFSFSYFLKRNDKTGIIAECKKASPSAGIIRADYSPVSISAIYESCGASAISILTDSQYFQGSLEDLKIVSNSVSIPVLRKDFIISEKQIFESRYFGASAILLIARILEPQQIKDYIDISLELGMEVLVETHSPKEIEIAIQCKSSIIGINTRDLDSFSIQTGLIPELANLIPNSILKVGESGIKNSNDYWDMKKYVDSVLIGTYFMKSTDIQKAFEALINVQ